MNTTTKRYPRTLDEAFGPYQRHGLVEYQDPMPLADKLIVWAGAVGLLTVGAMALLGWIK
jgi:hypothetical protein